MGLRGYLSRKGRPRMLQFPVFLVRNSLRDRCGNVISHAERRLVRQSPDDRVLAVVEAPKGSRIRSRQDPNGPDQLVVPLRPSLWGRFFSGRVTIPAKYLMGDARRGAYGLSLVRETSGVVVK